MTAATEGRTLPGARELIGSSASVTCCITIASGFSAQNGSVPVTHS